VRHPQLAGVSLALLPGELVAVSGQTARGKSTLIPRLAGTLAPTLGEGGLLGNLARMERARSREGGGRVTVTKRWASPCSDVVADGEGAASTVEAGWGAGCARATRSADVVDAASRGAISRRWRRDRCR